MSDKNTEGTPSEQNTGGNAGNFTPPATQDDLDRIIEQRLARERAKFADYDDLRTKASEYDKFVESQKTEQQKAAEELERLRKENQRLAVETLRNRIAAEKGVPANLLSGDSEEALTASADALIAFKGEQANAEQQRRGPFVPDEGRSPRNLNDPNAEALRVLGF